jgi:steroid 5-alpha reductase family enzyme
MPDFWISLFVLGFCAASLAYLLARRLRVMALVDTVWTAGVGLAAITYLWVHQLETAQAYLVAGVIGLWSLRLTYHLLRNRVLPGQEDPRYVHLARYWGGTAARNFYFLFLAQVLFVALFVFPVSIAMRAEQLGLWDGVGVAVALLALFGESLADRQLAQFRSDPVRRRQVCQTGLWRYCRHPNYFFEWMHWLSYVCFAIGAPAWALSFVGPIAMYLFLRFLTGVPHSERSSLSHRGAAYRTYQQTTNAFFPWKPHQPKN